MNLANGIIVEVKGVTEIIRTHGREDESVGVPVRGERKVLVNETSVAGIGFQAGEQGGTSLILVFDGKLVAEGVR